jgi:hypothetical protein
MSDDATFAASAGSPGDDALGALLCSYWVGSSSAAEIAVLEARLIADEAFADRVSQWCLMHRQIGELKTESALHEMTDQFVQGTPGPPRGVFAPTSRTTRDANDVGSARVVHRRTWRMAIVTAATLAAVGIFTVIWRGAKRTDDAADLQIDISQNNSTPVCEAIIATVTRAADAVWAPGAGRGSRATSCP